MPAPISFLVSQPITIGYFQFIQKIDGQVWNKTTYVAQNTAGTGGVANDASQSLYAIAATITKISSTLWRVSLTTIPAINNVPHHVLLWKQVGGSPSVVNGDDVIADDPDYNESITAVSESPTNADQTLATGVTYDGQGNVEGSVNVDFQLVTLDANATGAFSGKVFTKQSTALGSLSLVLAKSTKYQWRRGKSRWSSFTTGTADTYALGNLVGCSDDD